MMKEATKPLEKHTIELQKCIELEEIIIQQYLI